MTFRSRRLLDLAHRVQQCQNCGKQVIGCEPAHINGADEKGFGHKSSDAKHAALCHDCHAWYDQGTGRDPTGLYEGREGKKEMWTRAHFKTFDIYWREEWVVVK